VRKIAKTELTMELEQSIHRNTNKQGTFGCFEVTIGWFGRERVDYMTYDTQGIWRCYEIKTSKSDFYSKAHKTFVGHYNYFVMPKKLYEEVKDDIPSHIGVYAEGSYALKKAKKQELTVDEQILKNSMIRSLCREAEKLYKINNPRFVENMNSRIRRLEQERDSWRTQYQNLMNIGYEKYGIGWYRNK
jgi:hypothetical protein